MADDQRHESALGRAAQRAGAVFLHLAERLAERPRGQQLLRHADRTLQAAESCARALSRRGDPADAADRAGATCAALGNGVLPPPIRTSLLPVVVMLAPVLLLAALVLMLPVLRYVVPLLVGYMLGRQWSYDLSESVRNPTPAALACVKWIRRQRRNLRAVRYAGLRTSRTSEQPAKPPLGERLFLWTPVTVMAVVGEVMGLGGQRFPVVQQGDEYQEGTEFFEGSPRKRKLQEAVTSSSDDSTETSEGEEEDLDGCEPLEHLVSAGAEGGGGESWPLPVATGDSAGEGREAREDEPRRVIGRATASLLNSLVTPSEDSENDPDFEPDGEIELLDEDDYEEDIEDLDGEEKTAEVTVIGTEENSAEITIIGTEKNTAEVAVIGTENNAPEVAVLDTENNAPEVAVLDTENNAPEVAVIGTENNAPEVAVLGTENNTVEVTVIGAEKNTAEIKVIVTEEK